MIDEYLICRGCKGDCELHMLQGGYYINHLKVHLRTRSCSIPCPIKSKGEGICELATETEIVMARLVGDI